MGPATCFLETTESIPALQPSIHASGKNFLAEQNSPFAERQTWAMNMSFFGCCCIHRSLQMGPQRMQEADCAPIQTLELAVHVQSPACSPYDPLSSICSEESADRTTSGKLVLQGKVRCLFMRQTCRNHFAEPWRWVYQLIGVPRNCSSENFPNHPRCRACSQNCAMCFAAETSTQSSNPGSCLQSRLGTFHLSDGFPTLPAALV